MSGRYPARQEIPITDPGSNDPIESVTITIKTASGRKYKVRTFKPDQVDHGIDYLSARFADEMPEALRNDHVYNGQFFAYTAWVKVYMTGRAADPFLTREDHPPKTKHATRGEAFGSKS